MLQVAGRQVVVQRSARKVLSRPRHVADITVRHLLTHTSGIPDYNDGLLDYRKDYTEDELVKFAAEAAARLHARCGVEIQQHRLHPARRHRPKGIGNVLRRCAARSRVHAARHDHGACDQRGRHRRQSRRRISARARPAAQPEMGLSGAEHDRGRLVVSVAAGSHRVGSRASCWAVLSPRVGGRSSRRSHSTAAARIPTGSDWKSIASPGRTFSVTAARGRDSSPTSRATGNDITIIALANLAQAKPEEGRRSHCRPPDAGPHAISELVHPRRRKSPTARARRCDAPTCASTATRSSRSAR